MEVDGINLAIGGGAVSAITAVVTTWIKARFGKTKVEPDPLNVNKVDKYVTRGEFNAHVADNTRDHENLFARLAAVERLNSHLDGILTTIVADLQLIKQKLFKTK